MVKRKENDEVCSFQNEDVRTEKKRNKKDFNSSNFSYHLIIIENKKRKEKILIKK